MQKLGSQVIDFYDDKDAMVLKQRFPTLQALPEMIKKGGFLDSEERSRLRNGLYALVIQNEDKQFRKFACTDACNTALSIVYLLDHAKSVLPEAAVKTAAQNMLSFCKIYDIKPPEELEKLAGAIPDEISPFVDVTNMEVDQPIITTRHCLKKEAKYAIDGYSDVLKARDYFEKNASLLHPSQRREYSMNLATRALDLGIPLTETIEKYAANGWNDKFIITEELSKRLKLAEDKHKEDYKALFTKIGTLTPGVFANMLLQVDEDSGLSRNWDNGIKDPFSAVLKKEANTFSYTGTQGYIDEEDLKQLKGYRGILIKAFGEDFYEEFKKNPVDVFKALPEPEKNTVIKLVAAAKKW